jgi:hypothetical protein
LRKKQYYLIYHNEDGLAVETYDDEYHALWAKNIMTELFGHRGIYLAKGIKTEHVTDKELEKIITNIFKLIRKGENSR